MTTTYNYGEKFHEDLEILGLGNYADRPYTDDELYDAYQKKVESSISQAEADNAYYAYHHIMESGQGGADKTGGYSTSVLPEIIAGILMALILPMFAFTGDSALKRKMNQKESFSYQHTLAEAKKINAFKLGVGETSDYRRALFWATCNRFLYRLPISILLAWLGFQAFRYFQSGGIENPAVWILFLVLSLYLFVESIVNLTPAGFLSIPANLGERKFDDILVEEYLNYKQGLKRKSDMELLRENIDNIVRTGKAAGMSQQYINDAVADWKERRGFADVDTSDL